MRPRWSTKETKYIWSSIPVLVIFGVTPVCCVCIEWKWKIACTNAHMTEGLRKSDIFWGKFSYIGAMLHIMGCLWIPDPSQISWRKNLPDLKSITTILFVSMNERSRFIMFISFLQIPIMVTDLGSTERDKFWEIQNQKSSTWHNLTNFERWL